LELVDYNKEAIPMEMAIVRASSGATVNLRQSPGGELMYDSALATASGMATHGAGTLMAGLNAWQDGKNQPVESFGEIEEEANPVGGVLASPEDLEAGATGNDWGKLSSEQQKDNSNAQPVTATGQKGGNNKKEFMEAILALDPDSKEVGNKKKFWYEVSQAQKDFDQAQEKLRAAKEQRTSPGEEAAILAEVRQTAERLKELRGRDEFKELLNIAVQKQGGEVADAFGRENADQSRIEAEIVAKYQNQSTREIMMNIPDYDVFVKAPSLLKQIDPIEMYKALTEKGEKVEPLGRGNLKGIPYEEGGGYCIHWGGDRYLQYHPERGSHHGGAYLKISAGKLGKKIRFNCEEGDVK